MFLQLNPYIPLITPLGVASAIALQDLSEDHSLFWVCFIEKTRICVVFPNEHVRSINNITMGRSFKKVEDFFDKGVISHYDFLKNI